MADFEMYHAKETSLGLAFLTLRPHRPRHLVASWYSLFLATLCFIGVHAAGVATAALMWRRSPGDSPDDFEQYHSGYSERKTQDALFRTLAVTGGLYCMLVVVACRAAFWEITTHPVFRQHNTARWITLAFHVLLGLAALGMWLASVAIALIRAPQICFAIGSVFDEFFGCGLPYIVVLGYINPSSAPSSLANGHGDTASVFHSQSRYSARLVRTPLLIVAISVYFAGSNSDINAFYALILWCVQRLVILGVLAWAMRSHPLGRDGGETPAQVHVTAQVA